jgi:ribosomal protein L37AE/L43A
MRKTWLGCVKLSHFCSDAMLHCIIALSHKNNSAFWAGSMRVFAPRFRLWQLQNLPVLEAANNNKSKEVTMKTIASIRNSECETTCAKCGYALIAPEWSEYVIDGLVLNLWTCTKCGHQFETEAYMPADPESKIDRKVLEEFFPSLLVA